MQEQPDSALRMLQTINRRSLRGETLARYALVYSIAQDKSGQEIVVFSEVYYKPLYIILTKKDLLVF